MSDCVLMCKDNGPLRVSGNFLIQDAGDTSFDLAGRTVISLCRCGGSANKPFCDGAHARIGFRSQIKARKLAAPGSSG